MAGLDSWFKFSEEEAGLGGLKGVVRQFAEALREVGVKIPSTPSWMSNSNARILKKGERNVHVLMHGYTPPDHKGPPFWGILKSHVEKMCKESPGNWGVVLLRGEETFEFGFWVHGEHFETIAESPHTNKDGYEVYKIHQHRLEENPSYAKRFRTVDEFLQYAYIGGR